MPAKIDISGRRFGRWAVLSEDRSSGALKWALRCDCGTLRSLKQSDLTGAQGSRSCGCLRSELHIARITTHGRTKHPVFNIWKGMKARCYNPNNPNWKNYGARGITICDRWMSFPAFWSDMAPTWQPGLTIEREDNDRGYEPDNCRWIPRGEQARNRRWCTYIDTPKGRLTINEAARTFGISYFALRNRVRKGWPADQLLRPPAPGGRKKGCRKSTSKEGRTPRKA